MTEETLTTKKPTKEEFIAAILEFSMSITKALLDGKIDDSEFEKLGVEFANIGMELFGIDYVFKKRVPRVVGH